MTDSTSIPDPAKLTPPYRRNLPPGGDTNSDPNVPAGHITAFDRSQYERLIKAVDSVDHSLSQQFLKPGTDIRLDESLGSRLHVGSDSWSAVTDFINAANKFGTSVDTINEKFSDDWRGFIKALNAAKDVFDDTNNLANYSAQKFLNDYPEIGGEGASSYGGGMGSYGGFGGTGGMGGEGTTGGTGGAGSEGTTGGTGGMGGEGTTGGTGGAGSEGTTGGTGGAGSEGTTGGTGGAGSEGTTGGTGGAGGEGTTGSTGPTGSGYYGPPGNAQFTPNSQKAAPDQNTPWQQRPVGTELQQDTAPQPVPPPQQPWGQQGTTPLEPRQALKVVHVDQNGNPLPQPVPSASPPPVQRWGQPVDSQPKPDATPQQPMHSHPKTVVEIVHVDQNGNPVPQGQRPSDPEQDTPPAQPVYSHEKTKPEIVNDPNQGTAPQAVPPASPPPAESWGQQGTAPQAVPSASPPPTQPWGQQGTAPQAVPPASPPPAESWGQQGTAPQAVPSASPPPAESWGQQGTAPQAVPSASPPPTQRWVQPVEGVQPVDGQPRPDTQPDNPPGQ
ncbi:hypothetical protein GCM10009533_62390 [Saccharopolyspora spinosporotrichia]|uniref:PE-PGRS family protein n=1 Tax=Saccharopolyspora erythraea TaxID=1836 RepID=A0ABP3P4A0_SACER